MWSRISSSFILTAAALASAGERIEAFQTCMGTQFRVTVYATDIRGAQQAIAAAFRRGAELDSKLSDYKLDSELNELCRRSGGRMRVSEDLRRVIEASLRIARETDGAFDIALGKQIRRWREARKTRNLPPPDASGFRGYRGVRLAGSIASVADGRQLDLGGIAKGYAASEMLAVLRQAGYPAALVAASGDLAIGAPPPDSPSGWRVELGASGKIEMLHDCSVSTSGDETQFVEIEGVRYSHIVDPRTGIGLTPRPAATVIAPLGMDADALATALQVNPELKNRLLRTHRDLTIATGPDVPGIRPRH